MTSSTSSNTVRFQLEVENTLRAAGWFPGRVASDTQLQEWMIIDRSSNGNIFQNRMFSAAWRILQEFGGLTIGDKPGVVCDSGQIIFDPLRLRNDWWNDDFWVLEWQIGPIFPCGYTKDEILAITSQGQIINDEEQILGSTIEEALTHLIIGRPHPPQHLSIDQDKYTEACHWREWMLNKFG